jgi:hypothetical protein
MKILNNLDLTTNQLLNAKLQQLGSDITASGNEGIIFYNSATHLAKISNGTTIDTITNILENVTASGALHAGALTSKAIALTIDAASGSVPGTMSASDFTKLANATASATNSTLVLRDGSGNFSAGTITAALTGTASNASQLNSQSAAFYLSRANHTGTQLAATISDFDTQVRTSRLDQMAVPTASVSMNSQRITNVLDPTSPQDAATKAYVDATVQGLDIHPSVRIASTTNISGTYSATGGTSGRGQFTAMSNAAIDGVTPAVNNRVLLKDQSTPAQNGWWVITTLGTGANGVWDRAPDADSDAEVTAGAFTFVEEGTANADTGWVLTTNNPITLGGASGTSLAFAQFSSAGTITAGNGLTKTGNTIDVVGTANRISVAADSIDIDAAYVGQASITTLGTITTGTWTGTAIAVANGGTGGTSAAAAKTNLGFTTKFTSLLTGSSTTYTIAHGLGVNTCLAQVKEVATDAVVWPDITVDATNVVITFATAQTSNAFRVTVIG